MAGMYVDRTPVPDATRCRFVGRLFWRISTQRRSASGRATASTREMARKQGMWYQKSQAKTKIGAVLGAGGGGSIASNRRFFFESRIVPPCVVCVSPLRAQATQGGVRPSALLQLGVNTKSSHVLRNSLLQGGTVRDRLRQSSGSFSYLIVYPKKRCFSFVQNSGGCWAQSAL